MIACNSHGYPSLAPDRPSEPLLELPDIFLDLMFTDPPEEQPADEAEQLVA